MPDSPRLEQALEAYLAWCDAEPQPSWAEFLAENEGLRDLLEGMHADEESHEDEVLRTMGDFRILGELGRGGMGVVYRAEQRSVERAVALKVLPAHWTLDAHAIARFQREATLAGRLRHPGIVEVYTVGTADGSHFFAMELIEGVSLDKVLASLRESVTGPVDSLSGAEIRAAMNTLPATRDEASTVFRPGYVDTMVLIALRVAEALQHAHDHQILHRDVKPSNIMVGADGRVVLTDFGLAREHSLPSMTLTGDFIGTPHYVAPEQASGDKAHIGPAVDVFSLGATLYELVTLQRPFVGENTVEVIRNIQDAEPADPQSHHRGLAPDLGAIILRSLEKHPGDRYASAGELAEDLRAYVERRPVQARRVSAGTRILRWAQRNRALAATGVFAVGILLVSSLVSAIVFAQQNAEIRRARDEAVAVKDFLIKRILLSARPEVHLGRKPTVDEILDEAAAEVEERFATSPLLAAEIRDTLGRAWHSIGEFDKARRELEIAHSLRTRELGEDDEATLDTGHMLADAQKAAGRIDAAQALVDRLLPLHRRVLGATARRTLRVEIAAAQLVMENGDLPRAETLMRAGYAKFRDVYGENDAETLGAHQQVARLMEESGKLRDALSIMRDVLARRRADSDCGPAVLQGSINDLASILSDLGETEEATKLAREAVTRAEKIWGRRHPHYIKGINVLATEIQQDGIAKRDTARLEEAEKLFREALDLRREVYGSQSIRYAIGLNNLGVVLAYLRRDADASGYLQQCLDVRKKLLGPGHRLVVETRGSLGTILVRAKKYAAALPILADAAKRGREAFGAASPRHANILLSYGLTLMQLARPKAAESVLLESHAIFAKSLGEGHGSTRKAADLLAANYGRMKRPADAKRWAARARKR